MVMSLQNVETIIDRLLGDRELRVRFARDPFDTIGELHVWGLTLTPDEIDAFIRSDARVWFSAESAGRTEYARESH